MKTWRVTAWIKVPNPSAQVWNGSAYQSDMRQQQIQTMVMANHYHEARAIIEGQYGSSLMSAPFIVES